MNIISVPRSGQHMTERCLRYYHKLMNIKFNYCEFYHCCKCMPCKISENAFQKNHDWNVKKSKNGKGGIKIEKNNKYSPSQIKNIEIMTIKRNELEITTDSWFYYFSLQREGDGKYSLQFTDDALKANLLVFKTFYLIWEAKIHNWTIVGERLDYSRGITPERSEGKYKSFDEPIPFLSSK